MFERTNVSNPLRTTGTVGAEPFKNNCKLGAFAEAGLRWPNDDKMDSLPGAAAAADSCEAEVLHKEDAGEGSKGLAGTTGQ